MVSRTAEGPISGRARALLRDLFSVRKRAASAEEPPDKPPVEDQILEPSIYRFILKYSVPQQLMLLALTVVSFPFLYYSIDLPKLIINKAIGGREFPQKVLGLELGQTGYLLMLCTIFLFLVLLNGGFKYLLNRLKNQLGERMLRRFRYRLYQRMLHFPVPQFRQTSSAQIIPMITSECEELGGFIGEAVVTPAFQGGTLLTIIIFMFVQNPILGAAAVALYPLQAYATPRLQRRINRLRRERVRAIRQVADRVQESTSGIVDIVANDMAKLRLTGFANLLGKIYEIRFEIDRRKYFIKFLNNFIAQLTPFFFFSIGGYLVIGGQLSLGALVAVLAAYKDLSPPWRELLNFYQLKESSRIKYEQIIEQFEPGRVIRAHLLEEPEEEKPLSGDLVVANLALVEDTTRVVDGVSFAAPLSSHIAVLGQGGSGKGELAQLLAGLVEPTSGRITIGGDDLFKLPAAARGRRIGYVAATPYLFAGTLYDNFLLALRHRPMRPAAAAGENRRAKELSEALKSGNIAFDLRAEWTDYQSAGVADEAALLKRVDEVLDRLDFAEDVYTFGLRSRLDPEKNPAAAARFLEARKTLAVRLDAEAITNLVESWNPERYNRNASLAENLLFGTPIGPVFEYDALAGNAYVERVLAKAGLIDDLIEAGRKVAETMIELFADLPPGHEFFERYSFIREDELPECVAILARIGKSGMEGLSKLDRTRLLSLPLKLIIARHRLGVLDAAMERRVIEARHIFRADLPSEAQQQIAFFDPEHYHAAASVQDNILFGKIAYGEAEAPLRIPAVLKEVIDALDLRRMVIEVGLEIEVGSGGARLSLAQRQKAAIVRAVLKRPDLLVLNEATSALDSPAQAAVLRGLSEETKGRGLIWALHRASLARQFDRVLVMSNGRLEEDGRFSELDRKDSLMSLLMAAD